MKDNKWSGVESNTQIEVYINYTDNNSKTKYFKVVGYIDQNIEGFRLYDISDAYLYEDKMRKNQINYLKIYWVDPQLTFKTLMQLRFYFEKLVSTNARTKLLKAFKIT